MQNRLLRIPFLTVGLTVWLAVCFWFEWAIMALPNQARMLAFFGISKSTFFRGHFLRLATAGFFHMNIGHLVSNVIGLLFFLAVLECAVGSNRALVIVLVGELGGTLFSLLIGWVSSMVGSSTILFGVYGALGALVLKYRKPLGRYFALAAIIWTINLIVIIAGGYISLGTVDQGAHIGGFVAGVISALCIAHGRSLDELRSPAGLRLKIVTLAFVAVFIFCFLKEVLIYLPLIKT